ncbi:MAG: rRNA maturation RNase YbeY [Solirubrobacteraceae bacterium]
MLEVDVLGTALFAARVEELATVALGSAGIDEGHLAVAFVDAGRIAELNEQWRDQAGPTDVLSFPIDSRGEAFGPRELGDVVICPEHTIDLEEAVVHGVLHLVGMDHETDAGEMLAVQAQILAWTRPAA